MDGKTKDILSEKPAVKDDFVIGAGFTVDETVDIEEDMMNRKVSKKKSSKKNNKGCLGSVIWVVGIIVISVALAATVMITFADYLGIGIGRGEEVVVEISQGMPTSKIANELKEVNAVSSPLLFRIYTKLKHFDGTYKYGVYTFNNEIGYESIAKMLQTEGAKASSVKVTIPEGATVDSMAQILSDKGVCSKTQFYNAVKEVNVKSNIIDGIPVNSVHYRLEGYLFPDTYEFYNYDGEKCAELAVQKMVEQLGENFTDQMEKQAKERNKSIHEILTMASIIELEASSSKDEMPNVAAVFYNRLSWDEPHLLGSSPTAEYPYGSGRYDTNKTEGLPPGPLCAPSLSAIKAALNPTENFKATYFVTDKNMKFYYSNSLSEHQKTIRSLKSKGLWVG